MNANSVTDDQVTNLCKMGQGENCCSFLVMSPDGFMCAKKTDMAGLIHHRRSLGTMTAQGDNCSGPPTFTPNE